MCQIHKAFQKALEQDITLRSLFQQKISVIFQIPKPAACNSATGSAARDSTLRKLTTGGTQITCQIRLDEQGQRSVPTGPDLAGL